MVKDYTKDGFLEFLDYLAKKGLVKKNTVFARKAAVNSLLGIVDADELNDVRSIEINGLMDRFANLEGNKFTPASLRSYKSRYSKALSDFINYRDNPEEFTPSISTRSRHRKSRTNTVNNTKEYNTIDFKMPQSKSTVPEIIFPIPIRPGIIVQIAGLPDDLKEEEAQKITNVIKALANID